MKSKYSPRRLGFTPTRSPKRTRTMTPVRSPSVAVGGRRRLFSPKRKPLAQRALVNPYLRPLVRSPARRVQTRRPLRQAQGSRFKSYSSNERLSFFTNANTSSTVTFSSGVVGTNPNNVCACYLAPIVTTEQDRAVVGNKARWVAVNIFGRFELINDINASIRVTAVEYIGGGSDFVSGTNVFPISSWLGKYFKKVQADDAQGAYESFLSIYGLHNRWHLPRNIADYRILSEKWVTFNKFKKTNGGFHMYIPVGKLLDKDKTVTTNEPWSAWTSGTDTTVPQQATYTRYATVHPIMLLFEYIPGFEHSSTVANAEECRGVISFKYAIHDAI